MPASACPGRKTTEHFGETTVRRETKKPGKAQNSCRLGLLLISLANLEKEIGLDNPKTKECKSRGRGHYFGTAFTVIQLWDLGLGGA